MPQTSPASLYCEALATAACVRAQTCRAGCGSGRARASATGSCCAPRSCRRHAPHAPKRRPRLRAALLRSCPMEQAPRPRPGEAAALPLLELPPGVVSEFVVPRLRPRQRAALSLTCKALRRAVAGSVKELTLPGECGGGARCVPCAAQCVPPGGLARRPARRAAWTPRCTRHAHSCAARVHTARSCIIERNCRPPSRAPTAHALPHPLANRPRPPPPARRPPRRPLLPRGPLPAARGLPRGVLGRLHAL